MDRRKTLKTLLTGTVGAALVAKTTGCESPAGEPLPNIDAAPKGYGLRLPHEIQHDARIYAERFFTEEELDTLEILANIIAPGEDGEPNAGETGIREFLEFMAKDQPERNQTSLRGGLAWLNSESQHRYGGKVFSEISPDQRIAIVEDIAYPKEAEGTPLEYGARFFDHLRFMTVTCYFTSEAGMRKSLGYEGNIPNVWDGVPEDILAKHGKAYDPELLPKYVDQSKRGETARWDADKNLLS